MSQAGTESGAFRATSTLGLFLSRISNLPNPTRPFAEPSADNLGRFSSSGVSLKSPAAARARILPQHAADAATPLLGAANSLTTPPASARAPLARTSPRSVFAKRPARVDELGTRDVCTTITSVSTYK